MSGMTRMRSMFPSLIAALAIAGCQATSSAPTEASTPEITNAHHVSRSDYGKAWPFSVDEGTLTCQWSMDPTLNRPLVTFGKGDGIEYALNGAAIDFGYPRVDKALVPKFPNLSVLQPLIDDGLKICGPKP